MSATASQITSLTIVYSTVYLGADQRNQSSASLTFVQGIHRWPVNSPHKGPVARKMFPFDEVIVLVTPLLFTISQSFGGNFVHDISNMFSWPPPPKKKKNKHPPPKKKPTTKTQNKKPKKKKKRKANKQTNNQKNTPKTNNVSVNISSHCVTKIGAKLAVTISNYLNQWLLPSVISMEVCIYIYIYSLYIFWLKIRTTLSRKLYWTLL